MWRSKWNGKGASTFNSVVRPIWKCVKLLRMVDIECARLLKMHDSTLNSRGAADLEAGALTAPANGWLGLQFDYFLQDVDLQ